MSYAPKTWTDRVVERPMTYTVTNNPDGSITLTPAEGTVITAGDLVKADYLNAMEQGISDAHDDLALKAPLASPAFSGTVGLTELTNYGSAINEKVGTGTLTGTSVVITDSFIDANTAVSIIPIGAPTGTWGVVSSAGSFTVTSTASEASLPFKWIAIK